jgi:hypothetical protein
MREIIIGYYPFSEAFYELLVLDNHTLLGSLINPSVKIPE